MKRTSHAAALAASLFFSPLAAAVAADDCIYDDMPFETARTAEERLLGSADEAARYHDYQPFTREIAATGVVSEALASSLAEARVPATVLLEVRKALAGTVDLEREIGAGDRFYVRYRQVFTVDGAPIGTARLLWAELRTTAKGTIALHRFRPNGGTERLWLANGEAAGSAPLRLPLDVINVSSGFGLRPDPLDKPGPAMGPLVDPAPVAAAPPPEPPPPPKEEPLPPPRRPTLGGLSAFGGARDVFDTGRPDFHRRRAEPEPAPEAAKAPEPPKVEAPPPPPPKPRLFMHDGLDLVAVTGTEIYAAADGIVTGAGPNGRYGNWMQIGHAGKVTTVYGHLSAFAPGIEVGARVSQDELVGFVGNTGRSTGAHLHFEIVANGRTVNPLTFPAIKRSQLTGADLERFKKQARRSLEERDREAKVDAAIAEMRN
ncbi:MAG: peptidoglycan DD-metalloendopeptidase family protein [Rhodospirillales bacterium]|nr:peptidoglycan DD-metalloendopeptidase family protein [Rhodospirillales bacterium]